MITFSLSKSETEKPVEPASSEDHVAPVPRISIQAFCEDSETAGIIQMAGEDRRMAKAHLKIQMGGAPAAVEAYRQAPTPNLILLQATSDPQDLLGRLDELAESCDAGTRVIIIGRHNDVHLYRDLVRRGVSDYLIEPIDTLDLIRSISTLFGGPESNKLGRVTAVVAAKGGVGASTVAHNLAFSIAQDLDIDTVIADLDLGFGTAALDFNQDPPQGIAEAVFSPDRVDVAFVDRLLSKCTDHLSLLAAPAMLDRTYDFPGDSFDGVLDSLRTSVPSIVLDVPHLWSAWTRRVIVSADQIVIVAEPELASLRNAKNLLDLLKVARPNDAPAQVLLNKVGVPKRPEIKSADFAKALDAQLIGTIPFDAAVFGAAANNGQMIAETSGGTKLAEMFRQLAQNITGRGEVVRRNKQRVALGSLFSKLKRKTG